jgi:hypothetical protein
MTKLFTIVKDEVDIVEDWLIYHGCMFGWNNIFIIDNYSSDGTWEKINEYKDLVKIFREHDYSKKGDYMRNLINNHCHNGEIAFPIDIDEFVVYYDNNVVSVDKDLINNYINTLPICTIYKANYINALITQECGYEKATYEINYGSYNDMGINAKSFFNTAYYKGGIDHGNHINRNDYHLTKLCLVHYHARNVEQMKKKILNNVTGLGYHNDLNFLKNLIQNNPHCSGNHHVRNQINVLEGNYYLEVHNINGDEIDLSALKNRIIGKFF